jgi:hypothetical protein
MHVAGLESLAKSTMIRDLFAACSCQRGRKGEIIIQAWDASSSSSDQEVSRLLCTTTADMYRIHNKQYLAKYSILFHARFSSTRVYTLKGHYRCIACKWIPLQVFV